MTITNIQVYGLDEIKEYLSKDRIDKKLALGVHDAVMQLHGVLKTAVFTRYNRPNDIEKAFQRSSSDVVTGKTFITGGLVYKDTPNYLNAFPYSPTMASQVKPLTANPAWGNLRGRKTRQGLVHTATVKRGVTKKVYGKYGRGGFTRKVGGKVVMLERVGKGRFPLRAIYSSNLVSMINAVYEHDNNVKAAVANLEATIIDKFIP